MFISLNKKILMSLIIFLVFIIGTFFAIFFTFYAQRLEEGQNQIYMRNQYVVDLLFDNINLRKDLRELAEKYPNVVKSQRLQTISQGLNLTQEELSNEQQLNEELKKNYDKNREALLAGFRIIAFSLVIVVLFIALLIFLLNYWVLGPVEKLTQISNQVAKGIYSSRVENSKKKLHDEFDILSATFNQMLESTELNLEKIKSRELFLQQLIDSIPDAIRVIDKKYNVIMANSAFNRLFKIKGSCVGQKCYKAYGYDCEGCLQSKYLCPVMAVLNEKKSTLSAVHEVWHVPLYVSAAKLQFGDNKDDYYIIEAFHDLSNDVLFSHQQKISSLAFISTSVAHEMKNNLGAIRLIFEGILDNYYKNVPDDNEVKIYLEKAYKQLVETVKTPERLLRLAQFSDEENSVIEVSSAIKDMLLMVDYDAKRRGIEINTDFQGSQLIYANEADFKMIILNLAQNAVKAMPNGGKLNISTRNVKNKIMVSVSDTGTGISEEQLKHIFEPFYSANKTEKSSGLGLAIINSLVAKFRWRITVKSKLGRGTTFELLIPLYKDSKQKNSD